SYRPRDEGGVSGGSSGVGAHGGHGALLRRRPAPRLSHPARRQEPIRVDGRNRDLRDARRGSGGGGEPVGGTVGGADFRYEWSSRSNRKPSSLARSASAAR